jgi:predicted phage terminase large subunit-like protein
MSELSARHAAQRNVARLYARTDFNKFVPFATPKLGPPEHLRALVKELIRAKDETIEIVISTPPRHGKTTTILHALIWLMWNDPTLSVAYITYNGEMAESKSHEARGIAQRIGLAIAPDRNRLSEWMTPQGGRFVAVGIGGGLTGKGFRIVVVDDSVKDRAEAESALIRSRTWDWFNAVAYTRQEGEGTSYVVNATRWHPDDLSGRLIKQGWRVVNLPALVEVDGKPAQALWEEKWPVERLRKMEAQIGPYEWSSLYQGCPRAKGTTVFGPPTFYSQLPDGWQRRARFSLGGDFAYTIKTWSDYSVCVVLAHFGEFETEGPAKGEPIVYVLFVERVQQAAPIFRASLARTQTKYPGRITATIGGTEQGVVDLMRALPGPRLDLFAPNAAGLGDKFTRAQPAAAAWNGGRVRVPLPTSAPWVQIFIDEVCSFTGVKDDFDDQVDALANAFDPYAVKTVPRGVRNLPPG